MSQPKIAMLLPGLLLVFALTGCSNNSWRQFRNDANHSGQNSMSLLQPANVAAMVPSMVYNSSYAYIFNSQVVVDQLNTILNPLPPHNTLLFADGGSDLIAWDPDKNVQAWPPFSLASGSINSTPAVDDTRYVVYAMDADKLYAIDELKGTLLWYGLVANHNSPTFQGPSPTIYNGFVYAPSGDGHVYKFDPAKCTNNQKQCAAVWQSQGVGATYQGFYTSPSIVTTTKGRFT